MWCTNPRGSNITNCLRVTRNAWHFYYALRCVALRCVALRLVFKVVCGGFGIALLTP
ncbi:DUF3265 domain-containing protein [Vibrio cholerae]|nr:DUF3265 domain-containing protein [Vibrio cholerae]EID0160671.1 DUF3265 domain-containing protein [Vibrio cholerae]EJL6350357.1 DUF3265 domain-containing protein [Vibrio cholerae]